VTTLRRRRGGSGRRSDRCLARRHAGLVRQTG